MGNNGFAHFSRLGRSTGSAPNAGESQLRQNVEQEQQATFLGRPTTSYDPENPYLTSMATSQAADLRASTSATATNSTVHYSPATIGPPEDPFAALAVFQPTSFEEQPPRRYSGFHIADDFSEAFLEELETAPITGQPAGRTTRAPVTDSSVPHIQVADISPSPEQPDASMGKTTEQTSHLPYSFLGDLLEDFLVPQETQQVSSQDNLPANPPAGYQGHASVPLPSVLPQRPEQSIIIGLFYPAQQLVQQNPPKALRAIRAKPDSSPVVSSPIVLTPRVNINKRGKKRPGDEYILCNGSSIRRYKCGYPGCVSDKTFLSIGHLRAHIFEHTHVSGHRCTYPECGPDAYFPTSIELTRHISRVHLQKKQELICEVCHRRLGGSKAMKAHVHKQHSKHSR